MHLMQNKKIKKSNNSIKNVALIISLFILITIALLFIAKSKKESKNLKKTTYEEIIKEINAKKNLNFTHAEKFIIENENIYGTLVSLSLAKTYILKNNLEKAFIQLKNSLKYTQEDNLKNILKLRMAQIKVQQNKTKDAMKIIEEIKDNSWKSIVDNIKGDIFIKNGNVQSAIKSWENSKHFEESKTAKEIINMKINELK